jgi:hypothetical protein
MRFTATLELHGRSATGIVVPDDVVAGLGTSKRPSVAVTINGHSYRSTIARMGGRYLLPVAAEHREAAGIAAGESVSVDVVLDEAPREVGIPDDLVGAMDDEARAAYDALSFTYRKEWVRWVEDAKRPETRATRIAKTVEGLKAGKKTH